MPHIPRSMAPSGMIDPSTVPRAPIKNTKPPVPYMGSSTGEVTPTGKTRKSTQMVGKLSMKDWDVSPMKVMQHLYGKELKADEYSGMVS